MLTARIIGKFFGKTAKTFAAVALVFLGVLAVSFSAHAEGAAANNLSVETEVAPTLAMVFLGANNSSEPASGTNSIVYSGAGISGTNLVSLEIKADTVTTSAFSVLGTTTGVGGMTIAASAATTMNNATSLVNERDSSKAFLAVPSGNTTLAASTTASGETAYWGLRSAGTSAFYGLPAYGYGLQVLSSAESGTATASLEIGIKGTSATTSGTYIGEILFTAVANAYTSTSTFEAAFAAASGTFYDGLDASAPLVSRSQQYKLTTDSSTGAVTISRRTSSDSSDGTYYYAMQAMSSDICNYVETPSATSTHLETKLLDLRDGNTYYITKAATGTCWMTQNLDLDLTADGLDSRLSDIGHDAYTPAATDYSSPASNSTISYWNSSSTHAPVATETYSSTSDYSAYASSWLTNSLDNGKKYLVNGCGTTSTTTPCWTKNYSTTSYLTTTAPATGDDHYSIGNYYQANAAAAGSYHTTTTNSTTPTTAPDSICPAGWRLPTETTDGAENFDLGDVDALADAYSYTNIEDDTEAQADGTAGALLSAPFYFVRAGYIDTSKAVGKQLYYVSGMARYWTASQGTSQSAPYNFRIFKYGFKRGLTFSTYNYGSVRCVAR